VFEVGGDEGNSGTNHGTEVEEEESGPLGSLRFGGGFYKIELKNKFAGLEGDEEESAEDVNLGNMLVVGNKKEEEKGEQFKEEDGWHKAKTKRIMKMGSGNGGNSQLSAPMKPTKEMERRVEKGPRNIGHARDVRMKTATKKRGSQEEG
jgi:hypothetical protein